MSLCKKLLIGILAATTSSACATTQAIRNLIPVIRHAESRKSVDKIILENAKVNQTIMFGENHGVQYDNKYVILLLPKLKQLGYNDICLEIDSMDQPFVNEYIKGGIELKDFYHPTNDVLESAKELGYRIHCIDYRIQIKNEKDMCWLRGSERDHKMYENMKKRIFDKDPNAEVVIFIGGGHISESEVPHPCAKIFKTYKEFQKRLGQILEEKLEGGNYSVDLLESDITHKREILPKVDLYNNGNLDFIHAKDYFIRFKLSRLSQIIQMGLEKVGGERE